MKKIGFVIILVIILSFVMPLRTLAMEEPKSVSLYDIEVFQNLIVSGDFLAVVPYNIQFTTTPDVNIDKTFLFRHISPDGSTENGTVTAHPAYNKGHGYGVVSFYYTSNMTWGDAYIFRVQENPVYYPAVKYWDFAIGASEYSTETDQPAALRAKIIDSAIELSTVFGKDLTTTSEAGQIVLSTYGELYYLNAIPGLQLMCPALFSVQLKSPDYSKRSWSTILADNLKTKYAGTFIADFMTGYAGLFSMEKSQAMTFLSIVLFLILVLISVWKFKASMMSAIVDGTALLILLMLHGFFSMILMGLFSFLFIVAGGIILFLNRA